MRPGGNRKQVLTSPRFCPQWNNQRAVSPAEASPVPCSSSAHQRMVDIMASSPLPNRSSLTQSQLLTSASNSSAHCGHKQTLLLQQHFHPDFILNKGNCQRYQNPNPISDNPLLLQLLTSSNNSNDAFPHSQQSKTGSLPTAEAFVCSKKSVTMPCGSKQYLRDDQILELIEKKKRQLLTNYRASVEKDFLRKTQKSSCSPQLCPSPRVSTPRELDQISKDGGNKEASDYSRHSPERSTMNSGTGTAIQSPEYVGIMLEAAAICSKKEGESPVVLQTPGSFTTVEELVKHRPTLTPYYNPSHQEYKSTWRNPDSLDQEVDLCILTKKMEPVDSLPSVADSFKCSESASTSSALETSEKGTCTVAKISGERLPQITADSENVRTHLSQNSKPNEDFAGKSLGSDGNGKVEDKKEFFHKKQEKEFQVENGLMLRGVFDRMYDRLDNLKYDDITDDEEVKATSNIFGTYDTSSQNKSICQDHNPTQPIGFLVNAAPVENVEMQLEDICDDEEPVTGNWSKQIQKSPPPASPILDDVRPSKQQLACTCYIYYSDTEDGFKQGLCPKCSQDAASLCEEDEISLRQECESELCDSIDSKLGLHCEQSNMDPQYEEDDEWLVVPLTATEVTLETIVIQDDSESGNEEDKYPSSLERTNQLSLSRFQKIKEYDTVDSFLKAKPFDSELPLKATSTTWLGHLPAYSNSTKLDAVEEAAFEPPSVHYTDPEDSCDTDDSTDYPSQAKPNYLTASSQVRAPSPLSDREVDSAEDGEVLQPPETIMRGSPPELPASISKCSFLPDLSTDEDEDSRNIVVKNNATIASTISTRFRKKTCKSKHMEDHKSKTLKKKRFKKQVITSDSEGEHNQDNDLKHMRNYSSGKTSTQPDQTTPIPQSVQQRHEQNDQNSFSVSSKVSVKRKRPSATFTSDHLRKESGKRKRPSIDAETSPLQKLSEKPRCAVKMPGKAKAASGFPDYKANNQIANTNVSETRKQKLLSRQKSQPLPNKNISSQSNAKFPERFPGSRRSKTLSVDGEPYRMSSLPGCKQSQSKNHKPSISRPNQGNSYSIHKSTPAKQRVVKEWESEHVPTRQERRASNDRDTISRNSLVKTANGRDHEMRELVRPPPRQRHKSSENPLMKKSIAEAKEMTNRTHRQGPTERNPDNAFPGFKWTNQQFTNDWDLDKERASPDYPNGLTEY